ncbi:hypothetical protein SPBR_00108 [Sporothrix brasiliensis 5110]|uniref:Tuberous sclerosis 1 n=1 Tax=Sporothrix brasiliensis 5110 TaxID=1398154 RepID=A0A0C2FG80_9PEZI|nr:uncharacterized protein SPBR_00108 [Sporothrix brasiliensis 5110]KIH90098.1 hypothetical protein SPBR_00108 [Sporothrix brasiliensis 5110]
MSSSGSTRDLHRAIQASLASPKLPLSDEVIRTLDAYLDKHPDHDQATSDRLHEDLLTTFSQSVHNKQSVHYACFLAILRQLRPAIRSTTYLLQWWEKLIEPVFDHLGDERGPSGEVLSDVGQFLFPDDDDADSDEGNGGAQDTNKEVASYALGLRLLQKWMDVYHIVLTQGYSSGWTKEQPMQEVLLLFGKRKPKEFFHVLNDFFVQKFYRTRSISLLSELIRSQPPHLYLIIKSPLFESLLRCLQKDTSTTVVSLALTCLTMLLPNMPGSIVPYLPTLFNIYARILFWDREQPVADDLGTMASPSEQSSSSQVWEKCTFTPEIDRLAIPHLLGYFNILYGLYPLNFMDYIRKPQRYLRHANARDTDDVEVQPSEIRDRSEKYRQCHMLHPNFYSLTIESEKTDFGRWMKSATADVVAECVSLHISVDERHALRNDSITQRNLLRDQFPSLLNRSSALPAASDVADEETAPNQIVPNAERHSASTGLASVSTSSRDPSAIMRRASQCSQSSDIQRRDSTTDSPTLGPLLSMTTSRTDVQDGSDSTRAAKLSIYQSQANDSVQSLSLSHQESIPERLASPSKVSLRQPSLAAPSPLHQLDNVDDVEAGKNAEASEDTLMEMRRQILLSKNDLNFERYMVQQHLAHIGALRRSNVREAVTEAETQRLIIANRTLKQRLEEAKKAEAQVKKEAEMSRNMSRNWGDSLARKVKKLSEEHKAWKAEEESLRRELKVAQQESARLLAVVCEMEVRELKAKQDMQMLESAAAEMNKLKEEVKTMEAAKRQRQKLETQLEQTQDEVTQMEGALKLLQMKLEARESDLAQTRTYYQHQVVALSTKLGKALGEGEDPGNGVNISETRAQVDNALAASRAKYMDLQKKYAWLMRRYTLLESKRLELGTSPPCDEPNYGAQSAALSDPELDNTSTQRSHPIAVRGSVGGGTHRHRQRVASDAGLFDAPSPGSTWPAQMSASIGSAVSSPSTVVRRPSTPSGPHPSGEVRGESPGSTSPQAERYYGRGGVQNTLRKERKDSKRSDEPGDKRDKKPNLSGIRGIRGLV